MPPRHPQPRARAAVMLLLLLVLVPPMGCASSKPKTDATGQQARPAPSRTRADLITREEIDRTVFTNAFDLVQALRSNWLQPRGQDTFLGKPGQVQVRIDNTEAMGGVERLREIPAAIVDYIRWVDPVDAAGRWGIGYGHGAIHVVTRTR